MEHSNFKLINFTDVDNPYCNVMSGFMIYIINMEDHKVKRMESLILPVAFQVMFISTALI